MIYRVIMDGNDILNFQERAFVLASPSLSMELNAAGSFEFTMPPSHTFYDDIKPILSTIEVYEDETLLWFGRPMEIKTDYYRQKQVYCEGAMAFFNDSVQRPHEYDSISIRTFFSTVIANHNSQVSSDRQFTVGTVTVPDRTVYRKLNYDSTFDVLKRQCLSAEGGYFFLRREDGVNYIDWLAEMPYTCNQPVEFGLNLLDMTSGFDGSSIATCVVPLGEQDEETGETLTVASVNDGSDVIESDAVSTYGRITKAVSFSGVKEASTLYDDGLEYLEDSQFDGLTIECSAAELHFQNENYEQFRVGQTIHCRSVPHLVDREFPLMKMTIRLDTAAKQITLGTVARQSLTQIYKEDQDSTMDAVQELVDNASYEDLEQLGDRIDDLESLFEGIENIEDLQELIEGYGDIQELLEDLDLSGLGEDLSGLGEDLSGLQDDVSGIQSDISDIQDSMTDYQTDLNSVQSLVNGIVDGSADGWRHWFGTASDYTALSSYDNHTIYYIQSSESVDDYFIHTDLTGQ